MSNAYARYVPTKRNTAPPPPPTTNYARAQPASMVFETREQEPEEPAHFQSFVHPSRANANIVPDLPTYTPLKRKHEHEHAWQSLDEPAQSYKKPKRAAPPTQKQAPRKPNPPPAAKPAPQYESKEVKRAAKIARRAHQRALEQGLVVDDGATVKVDLAAPRDWIPPKAPAQQPETTKPVEEVKPKEKRPPKRQKVKAAAVDETKTAEWIEEEDKKHKALLAKRERSMKKLERIAKREEEFALDDDKDVQMTDADAALPEPIEVHTLEPLPQPEPKPEPAPVSIYSALPSWLGEPIRVAPTATATFEDLGLSKDVIGPLAKSGFNNAFAVQSAVLPLLLPGPNHQEGDVLVSAATGSGKTLSYVLPIVDDISKTTVTQLRGLIVMPTRELVSQARDVFDICANAYGHGERRHVSVGVAIGNQTLKQEQAALMRQDFVYNPEEYQARRDRINAMWSSNGAEVPGNHNLMEEADDSAPLGHLIKYRPKVDVLICTPGRLVEHLKVTPGFTLEHLKWLIIDEADKLLDQSFQQWLETVTEALASQEKVHTGPPRNKKFITKVVLSATMTRSVGLLSGLKLHKPKFVVLEGSEEDAEAGQKRTEILNLPDLLHESAVKVDDEGLKPLYLLEILKTNGLLKIKKRSALDSDSDTEPSDSESPSDPRSDSDTDTDSSDSDNDSDSDSSSSSKPKKTKKKLPQAPTPSRGALIFTKSNENAVRLGRLLALLTPKNAGKIGVITSTTSRKRTLRSFRTGKHEILIASDLVARGLDLPNLAHVLNYDMPTSLTSYVHRVGRTARAGREGKATTLFTASEGRWFWNDVARSGVKRKEKVDRITISAKDTFTEGDKRRYEKTLEKLGKEASGVVEKK